jgi:mRNA interferase HigB
LVISYRTLREFAGKHSDSLEPLKTWHKIASKAAWSDITDVTAIYPHADAVGKCTAFNIGGNDFRLVVQIDYEAQLIYVKKVMTHAEYGRNNGKGWRNHATADKAQYTRPLTGFSPVAIDSSAEHARALKAVAAIMDRKRDLPPSSSGITSNGTIRWARQIPSTSSRS